MMAYVTLEDLTGVVETIIWPDTYEKCTKLLTESALVIMRGRAEVDERWRDEKEGAAQNKVFVDAVVLLSETDAVARLLKGNGRKMKGSNGRKGREAAAPPPQPMPPPRARKGETQVHIKISADTTPETLGLLKNLLGQCRGSTGVCLHTTCEEGDRTVHLAPDFRITYTDTLSLGLRGLLGEDAVWLDKPSQTS